MICMFNQVLLQLWMLITSSPLEAMVGTYDLLPALRRCRTLVASSLQCWRRSLPRRPWRIPRWATGGCRSCQHDTMCSSCFCQFDTMLSLLGPVDIPHPGSHLKLWSMPCVGFSAYIAVLQVHKLRGQQQRTSPHRETGRSGAHAGSSRCRTSRTAGKTCLICMKMLSQQDIPTAAWV